MKRVQSTLDVFLKKHKIKEKEDQEAIGIVQFSEHEARSSKDHEEYPYSNTSATSINVSTNDHEESLSSNIRISEDCFEMKRVQSTLDVFLKKHKIKEKEDHEAIGIVQFSEHEARSSKDHEEYPYSNTSATSINVSTNDHEESLSSNIRVSVSGDLNVKSYGVSDKNDIGNYINSIFSIDDKIKCDLIERPWKPKLEFKLPFSTHIKKGKEEKRYLNHSHLDSFSWLVFSKEKNGIFCKYCAIFVPVATGGSNKQVPLQKLVTKPLTSFAKLLGKDGDLSTHEKNQYHKNAVEGAKEFLKAYYSPNESILSKISSERNRQIEENTLRLKPIVETIILLGRQNIPLRGHRDDGTLIKPENLTPLHNEGNFRELLRFRVNSGDTTLQKHLENANANATYISKTTQNQIIECCGEEIVKVILERVNKAKYYCIIFDETTDISHSSQLSLCLSYLYENKRREDFISFIDVHKECFTDLSTSFEPKVTGKVLGKLVIKKLKDFHLDELNCVGIGTDGCSMMVSEQLGAVTEIRKTAKYGSRCQCFNHSLNLSISKSSSVQAIRNSIGTIQNVVAFFNASAKRHYVLINVVNAQLKGLCETRWIERSESLIQFIDSVEKIIQALEYISEWTETTSSATAKILRNAIRDVEFLVALHCQLSIFYLILPLSRLFQKKNLDLTSASTLVNDLISTLNQKRVKCEEEFFVIFCKISELLLKLDVPLELPRMTKMQKSRSNVAHSTPEDYYRRSIYIPMLDAIIVDLKSRFSQETLNSYALSNLLPKNIANLTNESLINAVKKICKYYGEIISHRPAVELKLLAEMQLWKQKWLSASESTIPSTVDEILNNCDGDVYPLVNELLKILLTLTISVASAERSFSSLRRLKTYLRSKMGADRLTGLALLHIHRDIEIDVNAIIERFAKSGHRRRDFVL